jgi:hypothetical protein
LHQKKKKSQVPMAHACNPRYSGGRDQEDHSLKLVWANGSRDPISKTPAYTHTHTHTHTKRRGKRRSSQHFSAPLKVVLLDFFFFSLLAKIETEDTSLFELHPTPGICLLDCSRWELSRHLKIQPHTQLAPVTHYFHQLLLYFLTRLS